MPSFERGSRASWRAAGGHGRTGTLAASPTTPSREMEFLRQVRVPRSSTWARAKELQPQFLGGLAQGCAWLARVAFLCGGKFAAVFKVFLCGL